ncbi:MAG: PhnD/SsuA/transferrin family substrate-binding protein [Spirochaetia bacterium]|jgi:phosphonate transport system substrate-binding protein|nr:PhnD/SsuA/transferrin family substrate-binding protein [Spirochaetia bacterium]
MKKALTFLLASLLAATSVFAQGQAETTSAASSKHIDTLKVYFVPSREPDEIITQTAPLAGLLKETLAGEGYTVDKVDIAVGTSYEAVGVALTAGTIDIGFIPASTYIQYSKMGADVILTATRAGLSNDSENPIDWNNNKPTVGDPNSQVGYYRALIIAGPSAKGKELAKKVNAGQKLTWDDLNSAKWAIMSATSSAGYVYPTMWLQKYYDGKTVLDLNTAVQCDSYGSGFARLASEQVDIICAYADARRDYDKKWDTTLGRTKSIWDETDVIGVTDKIMNDTISVSDNSPIMTPDFKAALQDAFIKIAQTDAGKKVIAIYSHQGYVKAKDSDYDNTRKANALMKSMSK